ncbi:MAG: ferrous iron transport protein A [Phycisphaerae bacterium]|nr:ferrous iron transport protein A [Phycisphaerae bacterium]
MRLFRAKDKPAGDGVGMTLAQALTGQALVVSAIRDDRRVQHRLAELGMRPGVRIKVVSHDMGGPFIIAIGDSRLALGRETAESIVVCPA